MRSVLLAYLALCCVLWFHHSVTALAVDDGAVLLKLARDLRDGTGDAKRNLGRSARFFEHVIERVSGETMAEATWELFQLLQAHPTIASKFTPWDLLQRAAESGNPAAQRALASALATGVFEDSLVPMDATRALVLDYVSALSGNVEAALSVGYRFHAGVGVARSCEKALSFYEIAANAAAEYIEDLGYSPVLDRTRLSYLLDSAQNKYLQNEMTTELVDYYQHIADAGDVSAATMLGSLFLSGTRLVPVNIERALHFLDIAAQRHYAPACGLLGLQLVKQRVTLLRQRSHTQFTAEETTEKTQSETARIVRLLRTGAAAKDANAMVGLGLAHFFGIGVAQNATRAVELLQAQSMQQADAGFYLGELLANDALADVSMTIKSYSASLFSQKAISVVLQGYSSSAQLGNVLAQHRLAVFTSRGIGTLRSCEAALASLKSVAEHGPWMDTLNRAQRLAQGGQYAKALALYAPLATLGVETAQFNAAYLLHRLHCPAALLAPLEIEALSRAAAVESSDEFSSAASVSPQAWRSLAAGESSSSAALLTMAKRSDSALSLLRALAVPTDDAASSSACEARALAFYGLSASQGNSDAYLAIGDFYYFGKAALNSSRAVSTRIYQQAAELHNTQALFNLALMHQIGDEVPQDFHLAKRYYDRASESDASAKLPRDVALFVMDIQKLLMELFDCPQWPQDNRAICENTVSQGKLWMKELLQYVRVADTLMRNSFKMLQAQFPSLQQDHFMETRSLPFAAKFQEMAVWNEFAENRLNETWAWCAQETSVFGWSILKGEAFALLILSAILCGLLGLRKLVAARVRRLL